MKKITFLLCFFLIQCVVFSQTYLLENFDTEIPASWTIIDEGGATGDSWISGMQGFGNSLDGTNGAIVDSDANGNGTLLIETLVSPVFDSSSAIGLYLDFDQYFNSIGGDSAIVEVFDGTNWIVVLNQITDVGSFAVPNEQHIDITMYQNANMQIRFVYNDGDVWAWYWMIDNVRVYNSTCNNPSDLAATVNGTMVDLAWTPGSTETSWEVINQIAGGTVPSDTDTGTPVVGSPTLQITDLMEGTDFEFYVRANCGANGLSIWSGPFPYRISGPGEACSNPIIVTTPLPYVTSDDTANYGDDYNGSPGTNCGADFGYLNGDDVVYQYTPTSDTSIDIELSNLSDTYAGVFVYDECADIGVSCLNGAVNGFSSTDLVIDNFSVVAGQTYYIVISTWASPQSVAYTLTITENTCIDPVASYNVVGDCVTAPQFFVEVNLTDLGSATTVNISDNQGNSQAVTSVDTYSLGPYPNATDVIVSVANADDANCTLTSPTLTQEFCQDFIVDCAVGPQSLNYCYEDGGATDPVIFTFTSSDGTPLNLNFNAGEVEVGWDELVVIDSDGSFIVDPADDFYGNNGDLSGLTYQSTGNTISFYVNSDGIFSCATEGYTPIDVTVSCATCINPAATYAVIDDCDNGEQYLIDVNVTSLGDATSLTISNNINGDTTQVTAVGNYQIGPFPFLQDVVVTLSNDQDINCVINSPTFYLLACPPDNDNCSDATVAVVNDDGTCALFTSGTILAATPSGIPSGSCFGDTDDDVWFQFTALHENEQISLLNIAGNDLNLGHAVFSGDCGTLTELYCSEDFASATPSLTLGATYFVRVYSLGSEDTTTTFDLCITQAPGNVIVDQTTYTVEELIIDVLVNTPCAQVSNVTWSTGTDFGNPNGIGYFSGNGVGFPFENGLILTTGNASSASGPNNVGLSEGDFGWPGDPFLTQLVIDEGINDTTNNATSIEFDFIPLSDEISFEFLMASEEYNGGSFECGFSDAFAFLLTDPNGNTTNLAVLPGTTTPITVTNIHQANASCSAANEEYFGGYTPDNLPPIAFDGRTAVFTAQAPVIVGGNYHIKLVIADAGDSSFDSGVYLKAGSFDIGEVELGADITIEAGTAVCDGEAIVLNTNVPDIYHTWYLDGLEIVGENTNILTATEPGDYFVQIGTSIGCLVEDSILIEFLPKPEINLEASDLIGCDVSATGFTQFNLTDNNAEVLGTLNPSDYTVEYYLTEQEAIDGTATPLTSPYTNVSDPQTIWVRVVNNTTGCFQTTSFNLVVNDLPVANPSPDISGCDFDGNGTPDYDLTENESIIIGNQSNIVLTYFTSQQDAENNIGQITTPDFYSTMLTTIYVRVEDSVTGCYAVTSFNLVEGQLPITTIATDGEDFEICEGATVPLVLTAVPGNWTVGEVSIAWYQDGVLLEGETGVELGVLEGGLYEVQVTFSATGCSARADQEVLELDNCVIPQGISPDGDGLNDTFDLSNFGVERIEIFNRHGRLVYSRDNYTDQWHGQSDGGEELPVGTYFYTMVYEGGAKTKSAWVYINR